MTKIELLDLSRYNTKGRKVDIAEYAHLLNLVLADITKKINEVIEVLNSMEEEEA